MAGEFVHLHLHTEYSLLDGACRIGRLMDHVKKLGQTAVGITDHGVLYGAVDFYKAAKKAGVKPIIGCEVYMAPRTRFDKVHRIDTSPYHLVLLCENQTGYQNLMKLVSAGFTEGFYNKPRIDRELLSKHSEGLIGLGACLAGEIPRRLSAGDFEGAKEAAAYYAGVFGKNRFYIEVQDHGIREQQKILPDLIRLSREMNLPLVATNDAHYIEKEDAKMQNLLICIQTNNTVDAPKDLEFETEEFYVKSAEEMSEMFGQYPGAIQNTVKIAEMCNVEFEFGNTKLPFFTAPDGEGNRSYFERLCMDGIARHYGENPAQVVLDRMRYELNVIANMGYIDYFLIVYDFIRFAKSQGIPVGPGRGSGAGSLAAYCIGITGVDPMRYGLLFERFLNPERVSMPDFDIDFCYERRQEVIDYVVRKYGADHVAQIITFGTMAARGAIRDVGRALAMSYQAVDVVAKQIPFELGMTIDKALSVSKELRDSYESDPAVKELIDMARKLEGMPRHASTHAAGVVITRDPVDSYVPLQKNDESIVTQYTMTTLEELGLLKMDFLGLRTLTVISYAVKMLAKRGIELDVQNLPLDEEAVYEMMSKGMTEGVFQFESAGMRAVLTQLRPVSIEDLIAVISLYRPGPMDSIPTYIRNRHNPALVTYKHPSLKPILEVTYGCIVYQEQVMQICRELAGFSYGRADLVRRAMSKKKADVMEKERAVFIKGSMERGISSEIANDIFDEMSSFASYAFNKSHAAAYAMVAYQTAYLKCRYPAEFLAALLTSVLDNTDKVTQYISECARVGIAVLPPDVNVCEEGFTVSDGSIRFGLLAVKNIGRGFIKALLLERGSGESFVSFTDFCERMYGKEMNRRTVESLIKCGALDGFGMTRRQMLLGFDQLIDSIDADVRKNIAGQINLFDSSELLSAPVYTLPPLEEFPRAQILAMEKETTGLYVSGHPLGEYQNEILRLGSVLISEIKEGMRNSGERLRDGMTVRVVAIVDSKKVKTTRSNQTMAFVMLADTTGSLEMLVFPKTLEKCSAILQEGEIVWLEAKLSIREDEEVKLICEGVHPVGESDVSTKARSDKPKRAGLFLKVSSKTAPEIEKIRELLTKSSGTTPVYLYYEDTCKYNIAPESMWIQKKAWLINQLSTLLGSENVIDRT